MNKATEALERQPITHELKCHPGLYQAVEDGSKPFEWRKDDRDYRVGDTLWLREWDPAKLRKTIGLRDNDTVDDVVQEMQEFGYTGRECSRLVTYIIREGFGIPEGYCIMGLRQSPGGEVDLAAAIDAAEFEGFRDHLLHGRADLALEIYDRRIGYEREQIAAKASTPAKGEGPELLNHLIAVRELLPYAHAQSNGTIHSENEAGRWNKSVDQVIRKNLELIDSMEGGPDGISPLPAEHPEGEPVAMTDEERRLNREFWASCWDDEPTREKVEAELADYRWLIDATSRVYYELTGGNISKPNTLPEVVIEEARRIQQMDIDEAVAEAESPSPLSEEEIERIANEQVPSLSDNEGTLAHGITKTCRGFYKDALRYANTLGLGQAGREAKQTDVK